MDYFTEQDLVRHKVQEMIDSGRESAGKPSPLVTYQSEKAVEILALVKRKGADNDKRKYDRIREAFDQNYAKLHPNKPSQ